MPDQRQPSLRSPRAWVLLSGGLDSAACLSFYKNAGFRVRCLHVSFGQPASALERTAAEQIAGHFNVPLDVVYWSGARNFGPGEIVGRNAFLYLGLLIETNGESGVLAMGVHDGTPYFDCSTSFMSLMQELVDGYCHGRVQLAAPFISWSKHQVFEYCKSHTVPIDLTYSCEAGTDPPCGMCLSCRDREVLYAL